MIRDQVIEALKASHAELERLGVLHASVFGSVARGEDRPDSDVDVLVDVDPGKVRGLFGMGRIQQVIQERIGRPVDLARRDRLRPGVAAEAETEAVLAF